MGPAANTAGLLSSHPHAAGAELAWQAQVELDLLSLEANGVGSGTPGHDRDVVELLDEVALEPEPLHGVAGAEVDHERPAPRASPLRLQGVAELDAREDLVL